MSKFRIVYQNGDVVNIKTDDHIDDAVIVSHVNRLRAKKTPKVCQIFSFDDGVQGFVPIKKDSVTISLTCL